MKIGKWEYWETKTGWRFHLRAANSKIILQSEGYKTEKGCIKGIKSIQSNVNAPIVKCNRN